MTEYTEYMETLKEQIQNKRARALVEEEIRGHIEEQEKEYLAEGMEEEEAKTEAVRQMGDPVETGCALNRIHRPAFPWKLFALAVFLTGASMLISLIISAKANEQQSAAPHQAVKNKLSDDNQIIWDILSEPYHFEESFLNLSYQQQILMVVTLHDIIKNQEKNPLRGTAAEFADMAQIHLNKIHMLTDS